MSHFILLPLLGLYFYDPALCIMRFGLQGVCITSGILLYILDVSLDLHVLASGTKRIRFFPRPCYRPILGINSTTFYLILCRGNNSEIHISKFLWHCNDIILRTTASFSLRLGACLWQLYIRTNLFQQSHKPYMLSLDLRLSIRFGHGMPLKQGPVFLIVQ